MAGIGIPGHVNNVTYVRYAETARINFMRNLAVHVDPTHRKQWTELCSSTGIGLILRSIKVDYKFVCVVLVKFVLLLIALSASAFRFLDGSPIYN